MKLTLGEFFMTKIAIFGRINFKKNHMFTTVLRDFSWLIKVRKSRLALAQLDPDRLEDIGISRIEADQETELSFWDAPANWVHR